MTHSNKLLKSGGCSIVLGKDYYAGHFPEKLNKVLKITRILNCHNEMKYARTIRNITNSKNYYAIPEDEVIELLPSSAFYRYLKNKFESLGIYIFRGKLSCFYVDYAGSLDLHNSISKMCNNFDNTIWHSYDCILDFAYHIMQGISYLHNSKLCHLDIKPENIMIDMKSNGMLSFKIIDFGFCSKEPFAKFINGTCGTPGYFPKDVDHYIEPGLPRITANDFIPNRVSGLIPMMLDYKMVYKIDSYCFGRTLNYLLYNYNATFLAPCSCNCFSRNKSLSRLNRIIKMLTKDNVYSRSLVSSFVSTRSSVI